VINVFTITLSFNNSIYEGGKFFNAISIVQRLGGNALCAKSDIKSAFRLLPIYPGSFDLLGIQLNENFDIDKMLPMGLSQSCSYSSRFF
jgi:hypothetical protein